MPSHHAHSRHHRHVSPVPQVLRRSHRLFERLRPIRDRTVTSTLRIGPTRRQIPISMDTPVCGRHAAARAGGWGGDAALAEAGRELGEDVRESVPTTDALELGGGDGIWKI